MGQLMSENTVMVVEYKENRFEKFAFKYKMNEELIIDFCYYCVKKTIMRSICQCKTAKYCDDKCLQKDKQ